MWPIDDLIIFYTNVARVLIPVLWVGADKKSAYVLVCTRDKVYAKCQQVVEIIKTWKRNNQAYLHIYFQIYN